MNHGGGGGGEMGGTMRGPPSKPGPRTSSVALGLDATKHTGNILRLLESSHGSFYNTVDTLSTVWHSQSLSWNQSSNGEWECVNPIKAFADSTPPTTLPTPPRLSSLQFSDDRTALVKL